MPLSCILAMRNGNILYVSYLCLFPDSAHHQQLMELLCFSVQYLCYCPVPTPSAQTKTCLIQLKPLPVYSIHVYDTSFHFILSRNVSDSYYLYAFTTDFCFKHTVHIPTNFMFIQSSIRVLY